jgi:glutamate synthase domain-containing protein 2
MTDLYDENLLELYSGARRFGLQKLGETELRASARTAIQRPLGSPKAFPNLDNLMFNIAQLETMPTPLNVQVEQAVTIGPKAMRPLRLGMPIMISGMAYGWALSEAAKVALAKGAAKAGTASNTGQGPWLESERQAAHQLIYQYHRGHWGKTPAILRQADAVEIQFGQGANGGLAAVMEPALMDERLRQQLQVEPGQPAVLQARHTDVQRPEDLVELVKRLRIESGGVPVGVKLAAGQQLEADMHYALQANVDYIAVDGAEGATKSAPPITEDDFGLPTLFAVVRANRYLEQQKAKDRVSLVISGGLKTPGDFLKAIALGADAVYIGAAALFAMAHTQTLNALPYEPPTQAVWYDGKAADQFDPELGSETVKRFLISCRDELEEGIRALGKSRVQDVGRGDLFALDRTTAEICGVPLGYSPQPVSAPK